MAIWNNKEIIDPCLKFQQSCLILLQLCVFHKSAKLMKRSNKFNRVCWTSNSPSLQTEFSRYSSLKTDVIYNQSHHHEVSVIVTHSKASNSNTSAIKHQSILIFLHRFTFAKLSFHKFLLKSYSTIYFHFAPNFTIILLADNVEVDKAKWESISIASYAPPHFLPQRPSCFEN